MIKTKKKSAIDKYNLKNLVTVYEKSDRAVYYADSSIYGQVVLKINFNKNDLKKEFNTLKEFQGGNCCKVYDYSEELLLEERIIPAVNLNNIQAVDERIDKFTKVFKCIHCKTDNIYPAYIDWLENAYSYCIKNNVEKALSDKMEQALNFGKEVYDKYFEKFLLHGDLHHQNILTDERGNCKIIDPKGVIGPEIFDIPRFILNELNTDINKSGEKHIRYVIKKISELLKYDESDIKKLFFMEVILGTIWCLEDGEEIWEEDIAVAEKVLRD